LEWGLTSRVRQLLNIQMEAIILAVCWPHDTPERTSNYEIGKIRKKQGKEGGNFYYQKLQCAMQRNIAKYRKV